MKCTLKAKCFKQEFLDNTEYSLECKKRDKFVYGFYEDIWEAKLDEHKLEEQSIECDILNGWNVDGFVTFEK